MERILRADGTVSASGGAQRATTRATLEAKNGFERFRWNLFRSSNRER
jgi:fructose-bisphosphate aldolase class 1